MCLYTGVSLQPAVQTTSSRLYSHQTSTIPVSSERSSLTLSFFCFLDFFYRWKIRWWLCPELTTISCSNLCGMRAELCCFSLWGAWGRVRVGTPRRRRGRRREGGREESEYNPVYCSHAHLLSLTPPGTRSDLCGDLAPSLLSLMRFPSALGKSHQIPCALQELSGGPSWRLASSRLPWLLFGSAAEPRCRVRLFAWQQRLQRLSH